MPIPVTFLRTRLAPTPSGYLHLGNIASFVLTLGLARRFGAKVLLRIDDLDAGRVRDEYIQDIFQSLDYLGLQWDEGPREIRDFKANYSQHLRKDLYQQAMDTLLAQQLIFACDCSRSVIRQGEEPGYPGTCLHRNIGLHAPNVAWRLATTPREEISMNDLLSGKVAKDHPPSQRYLIVRKKDGDPSYQLASVIDDRFFGVDLIVRGADLWESTLAQIFLAGQIGAEAFRDTYFVHHPLLSEEDGSKMSKSAGAPAVKTFRERGDAPAVVFREIARQLSLPDRPGNWEALAESLLRKWTPEVLAAGQKR